MQLFRKKNPFPAPAVACWVALCLLLSARADLLAATVELPLFLRIRILQNALQESLTPGPDRRADLYRRDRYNYFHIAEPRLSIRDGEPRFRCDISAGAGKPMGVLPSILSWNGSIEMNLFFYVDDRWQLRYRIIDSAIYDEKGGKPLLSSFVWKLSRKFLYPLLEDFSFDLSPPKGEILELLRKSVAQEDVEELEAILDTIEVGSLRADADGIVVPLQITVADRQPSPTEALPPQQPLTIEEIQGLQTLLEPLDAFLVFVVKSAGADFSDPEMRDQLFELLITSRYRLLAILAGEHSVDAEDPLRSLFIDAWRQLRDIIESSAGREGLVQEQLLRYMTFINAGDALLALDAAAPQLGMRITTDGLRRLARMLQPEYKEDPLQFDWEVDPALRNLFNFLPESPPDNQARTMGSRLLDILVGSACAAEDAPVSPAEMGRRLDRWVPSSAELDEYGTLVGRLLHRSALARIGSANLSPDYADIFTHLVSATALIESCWRQFLRRGDRVVFVQSKAGSLGMMQINQHVWRGFYKIDRLKWDVVYNVEAGIEILMRYFKENGLKVARGSGKPEDAARAAYCAYNAGPRAARRFMNPKATSRERKVDDRLWEYYRGIAAGGSVDLHTCGVSPGAG